MFCEYCGNEIAPGTKVCSRCGNSLTIQPEPVETAQGESHVATTTISRMNVPSPVLFIRWAPSVQDLQIYAQEGAPVARITKALGSNGFEIHITNSNKTIDLCLRQTTYTTFDVLQQGQVIAKIEERLVLGIMKLTPLVGETTIVTEHEKFATRKSFYLDSVNDDKVADLRTARPEEVPPNFDITSCFTLDVKQQSVDFLHLLGIVMLVLFRFR